MPLERESVLQDLADAEALWPLLDRNVCQQCAQPRLPKYAKFRTCWTCNTQNKRYGSPLDRIKPITYTTYDWTLGAGLRGFKDQGCPVTADWAAGFGAILSAYLEREAGRAWPSYDLVVPVPTTAPVIERSLSRATSEGWWAPPITPVAGIAPGYTRQRLRQDDRAEVAVEKWVVDRDALGAPMSVLVLDDMMTTGGSLFSFAKALRREGVSFVDAVVVARNVGHDNASWVEPLLRDRVARGVTCFP